MPLDVAISAGRGPGYTVYRVADGQVLASFPTYGEAARHLDTLQEATARDERAQRVTRWYHERYGPDAQPSAALLEILIWIDRETGQQ